MMKTQRPGRLRSFCIALAMMLLLSSISGCKRLEVSEGTSSAPGEVSATTPEGNGQTTASEKETRGQELSVTDLMKAVLTVKSDLETALEDIKTEELTDAEGKLESVSQKTQTIQLSLNATVNALGDTLPSMREQLSNMGKLLGVMDTACQKVLLPVVRHMQENPLTDMKSGDGIKMQPVWDYLDFFEGLMPDIEALLESADGLDFSMVDDKGKISDYLQSAQGFVDLYREEPQAFRYLKAMLGAEGDRLYVLAAQNSAEIRASGGFPGAVGTLRIQNGVLTVGNFETVYDVFSSYTPGAAKVTNQEYNLFHAGLSAPRDADYCPDFERVAYIWSLGYEAKQKEHPQGVVSLTPVVLQRMLEAAGAELTLSDGLTINGSNAVKVLQHDLYFKYFGSEYVANAAKVSDAVFAEAAKKSVAKLTEDFTASKLLDYAGVMQDSFQDRTLMAWMEQEQEQEILRKLHWNAGLNTDPEHPQAGVYFNCTVASKMGWYVIIDHTIGEGTENPDGSYTYPMTVTFSNDMTKEEIRQAKGYITGGNGGGIGGSVYFFAPAGGTVSNFKTDNGSSISMDNYHDLDLGFLRSLYIPAGKTVTVTYDVTTAPGVSAPLEISQTPTVQEYHG